MRPQNPLPHREDPLPPPLPHHHSKSRRTLTYVGELALGTQGHGQCWGGRQLGLVVGLGQATDGVGMPPLFGIFLGLQLVPADGSRTQPGTATQGQSESRTRGKDGIRVAP